MSIAKLTTGVVFAGCAAFIAPVVTAAARTENSAQAADRARIMAVCAPKIVGVYTNEANMVRAFDENLDGLRGQSLAQLDRLVSQLAAASAGVGGQQKSQTSTGTVVSENPWRFCIATEYRKQFAAAPRPPAPQTALPYSNRRQVCLAERAVADRETAEMEIASNMLRTTPLANQSESDLLESLIHFVRKWKYNVITGPEIVEALQSPVLLRQFAEHARRMANDQMAVRNGFGIGLNTSWAYFACLAEAEAVSHDRTPVAAPPPASRTISTEVTASGNPTSPQDACRRATAPGSDAYRACMVQIDVARYNRMHPPPMNVPSALEVEMTHKAAEEARNRVAKRHDPALEASDCVQRLPTESSLLYGGLMNTCDYVVNVAFCTIGATPGTSSAAFDCARSKGGLVAIPARDRATLHTKDADRVEWGACQNPGYPMDHQWTPGQVGIGHRCR